MSRVPPLATTLALVCAPALAHADEPPPPLAPELVREARAARVDGDTPRACRLLEQALALAPRVAPRSELALCWEAAGDEEQAREAWLSVASLADQRLSQLPAPSAEPLGAAPISKVFAGDAGRVRGGNAMIGTGFVLGAGGLAFLMGAGAAGTIAQDKSSAGPLGASAAIASAVGAVLVGVGFYVRATGLPAKAAPARVGVAPGGVTLEWRF